jgi:hypothetical protein
MSKNYFRIFAILFGGLVLAGSAYNAYRLVNQPRETWVPRSLAQELSTASDRVEVLVAGEPLQKALSEGRVTLAKSDGPVVLAPSQVTARLDSHDQAVAVRIPALLASAAVAGGALVFFLLGLIAPSLGGALSSHGALTELHLLHEA